MCNSIGLSRESAPKAVNWREPRIPPARCPYIFEDSSAGPPEPRVERACSCAQSSSVNRQVDSACAQALKWPGRLRMPCAAHERSRNDMRTRFASACHQRPSSDDCARLTHPPCCSLHHGSLVEESVCKEMVPGRQSPALDDAARSSSAFAPSRVTSDYPSPRRTSYSQSLYSIRSYCALLFDLSDGAPAAA